MNLSIIVWLPLAFLLSLAEMQLMRDAVTVFNPPSA